jgi:fucose permease
MMMLPAFFLGLMSLEQSIPRWGSWLIAFAFVGLFISGWMLFFAAFIEETLPKHLVFFPLPILCFIGLIWAYPRWVRPTQEK